MIADVEISPTRSGAGRTRTKFDALRAKHLAAKTKRDEYMATLSHAYGSTFRASWLKTAERKTLERFDAAVDRTGDAFSAHLKSFSPRDWSYGVPAHWVLESLTYEDAARSASEPLSVVPPLSWGASEPRR